MTIINLTNPNEDPVDGDQIEKRQGGLTINYTYSADKRSEEEIAREWRNTELKTSDWIMSVSDHSQLSAYTAYRKKLRDWPSTADFPKTKPTL
tara:strand:+ start:471 stop:749 length:279 start_codon:yes stop_codon:yes gene_type:complete